MTNPLENPNFIPKPEQPTEPQRPDGESGKRALESSEKTGDSLIKECEENIRRYQNMGDRDMEMREKQKLVKLTEMLKKDKQRIERADVIT